MKIALVGVAGIGKDFLADTLVNDYKYVKLSFARELKRLASSIFNIPVNIADNLKDVPKYNGYSIRQIWIELAKTIRKFDDYYFINKLLETIDKIKTENIIITDVRDFKELKALQQKGFILIYIAGIPKRPSNEYDYNVPKLKEHCDYVFYNEFNGTNDFKLFIEKLINKE